MPKLKQIDPQHTPWLFYLEQEVEKDILNSEMRKSRR